LSSDCDDITVGGFSNDCDLVCPMVVAWFAQWLWRGLPNGCGEVVIFLKAITFRSKTKERSLSGGGRILLNLEPQLDILLVMMACSVKSQNRDGSKDDFAKPFQ